MKPNKKLNDISRTDKMAEVKNITEYCDQCGEPFKIREMDQTLCEDCEFDKDPDELDEAAEYFF